MIHRLLLDLVDAGNKKLVPGAAQPLYDFFSWYEAEI